MEQLAGGLDIGNTVVDGASKRRIRVTDVAAGISA